jgi:glycosyltransferase involved in cell wall biosynthesis
VKVVHVPFTYFPDAVGGTEVYVADLVRELRARGVDSIIAAPADEAGLGRYEHEGARVYRFGVGPSSGVADLYGEGDEGAARAIEAIVEDVGADVLHLHAFTRAASLRAVRLARRQGAAVVFTYHTPTASCVRGTLLHEGRTPCDGTLDARRCASCLLESHGLAAPIRDALSHAPAALGAALAAAHVDAPWATALRARELVAARHAAFTRLLAEADAIVAVCEWVRTLLERAGARADRLVMSRQGTPSRPRVASERNRAGDRMRLAFVGRLHPTKGLHVVLRALAAHRDLPVTLDIYGVAQDAEGRRYASELAAIAAGDARVRLRAPVPSGDVVETLADYDATVVPSQWLETGPLTVLESFAAGVPVVGSDLGGIAELVSHDRDGWLVAHADQRAWGEALGRLASDPDTLERLRRGVQAPRTADDVAADMASLYESVVSRRARSPVTAAGVA